MLKNADNRTLVITWQAEAIKGRHRRGHLRRQRQRNALVSVSFYGFIRQLQRLHYYEYGSSC